MVEKDNINLKKLRIQTKMSQKKFGEYFGIPYRTIQNWESELETVGRNCPEYVLKLIEFRLKADKLID